MPTTTDQKGDPQASDKLLVARCRECKQLFWYPRPLCPFCFGDAELEAVKGTGVVYTFSITRRGGPEPYCIAYVELDEGPRMLTRITDCDFETLRIGDRVKVGFRNEPNGARIPVFTPT